MAITAPELLGDSHELADFVSGESALDKWLKRLARANQLSGASRTYVICEEAKVVGFYALSSGAISVASAPGRFRRNMPEPIPVVVLGRLAVSSAWHGRRVGRALVRDAALRVEQAADIIGIRGIVVHAISEAARRFYVRLGFDECPALPMVLVITLGDLRAALS